MIEYKINRVLRMTLAVVLAAFGMGGGGNWLSLVAQAQEPVGQSASNPKDAGRTDGQIEMDVVHALDAAPELKQDWITAGTVQGEVTLSGTTVSDANLKLAESIAASVPGVRKVVNSLRVGDPQNAQNDPAPQQSPDQDVAASQNQPPTQQPGQPYEQQAGRQSATNSNPPYPAQPEQNGQRPSYQPAQPLPATAPERPRTPVTVAEGTLIKVRSMEALNTRKAKDGTPVEFTVVRDIYAGGVLAIPRGATVEGVVTQVKKAGALGGSPELALKLTALQLEGNSYALETDPFSVKGPNKAGRTVSNAFGGAVLGAIIGGAVGGGGGAAIGAGAGAVGGTAASAATPGPNVWIPSEALMDFHLNAPITVTPVSRAEAQRLSTNVPPPSQRPTLYRRAYYPYGYPPPPPPGYYYRPY